MQTPPTTKYFERFVKLYLKNFGNVSATCKKFGICRRSFSNWYNLYPEFKEMIDDADESLIDFTETAMFSEIAKGNTRLIEFHLSTKGKKRGYGKTYELTQKYEPLVVEMFPKSPPVEVEEVVEVKEEDEESED